MNNPIKNIILSIFKERLISKKNNIAIIGETGTGKSLLAEKIADYLDWHFWAVNSERNEIEIRSGRYHRYIPDYRPVPELVRKISDNNSKDVIILDEVNQLKNLTNFRPFIENALENPHKFVIVTSQDWSEYFDYCQTHIIAKLPEHQVADIPLNLSCSCGLEEQEYLIFFNKKLPKKVKINLEETEYLNIYDFLPSRIIFKDYFEKKALASKFLLV